MTEKVSSRLLAAWTHTRRVSGSAVESASQFASTHRHTIAGGTHHAIEGLGRVSESAGKGLARRCQDLRRELRDSNAGKVTGDSFLERATDKSLGFGSFIGSSLMFAGKGARTASPAIGAAAGGVVVGTIGAVSGAVNAIAIQQSDIEALQDRLLRAGKEARLRSRREMENIDVAHQLGRRAELLDLLVVGGVSLSSILDHPADVPEKIERAFELAYPGLASSGEDFSQAVARIPTQDLMGLVSGVKGKLFEIELVDQLNHAGLVEGLHAELAASATQPGYDIKILDSEGHVARLLQAKATDSVAYVKEALERYPNIDVTTTSEVHGQLVALGLGEHVSDGGLTDAVLQSKVEAAAGLSTGLHATDFVPSALGLAVLAYSAFSARDASVVERSEQFGMRAGKAGLSGGAGAALMLATGTWVLAPVGGIGFRVMAARGDAKLRRFAALTRIVESLEAENARRAAPEGGHALRRHVAASCESGNRLLSSQ